MILVINLDMEAIILETITTSKEMSGQIFFQRTIFHFLEAYMDLIILTSQYKANSAHFQSSKEEAASERLQILIIDEKDQTMQAISLHIITGLSSNKRKFHSIKKPQTRILRIVFERWCFPISKTKTNKNPQREKQNNKTHSLKSLK